MTVSSNLRELPVNAYRFTSTTYCIIYGLTIDMTGTSDGTVDNCAWTVDTGVGVDETVPTDGEL